MRRMAASLSCLLLIAGAAMAQSDERRQIPWDQETGPGPQGLETVGPADPNPEKPLASEPDAKVSPARQQAEADLRRELEMWDEAIARYTHAARMQNDREAVAEASRLRDQWFLLSEQWRKLRQSDEANWATSRVQYDSAAREMRELWNELAEDQGQ